MLPLRPSAAGGAETEPGSGAARTGSRLIARHVLEGFRRERIFLAIAELAHEKGLAAMTTARIVRCGRMSRNTFYELFADKAQCLDLACEFAADRLATAIRAARPETGGWRERLGSAIGALIEYISAEPAIAELCLVHAPSISSPGTEPGTERVIEVLVEAMEDGDGARGDGGQGPTPGLEEFVAATIVSIVVTRVRRGEGSELGGLQEEITALAARLWSEPAERVGAP
jgi:AcrR family transcriptional regulator